MDGAKPLSGCDNRGPMAAVVLGSALGQAVDAARGS